MYSESKKSPFQMLLSVSLLFQFSPIFCQTKVTIKGNTERFPLVSPNWICSFQPFRIRSKYLKETVIEKNATIMEKACINFFKCHNGYLL